MGIWRLAHEKLTINKKGGGLGLRDFYGFILAVLGKQGWQFLSSPEAMVSKIFKAKYFPGGTFWMLL